jgi:hypothetical protein
MSGAPAEIFTEYLPKEGTKCALDKERKVKTGMISRKRNAIERTKE